MTSFGVQRFRVAGFGSLSDATLEPGRLTVLIGENGSGKSNFLKSLRFLMALQGGFLQRFVGEAGGASALLHYGAKKTQEIRLEVDFRNGGKRCGYRACLGFAADDSLVFLEEDVVEEGQSLSLGGGHRESKLREKEDDARAKAVSRLLGGMAFFHVHDTSVNSPLRTNSRAEDDQGLRANGSNLAAYLGRLKHSSEEGEKKAWKRFHALVRRVSPSIQELSPTYTTNGKKAVRLDWLDDQGERFGVHQLSDGTLRVITLLAALTTPSKDLPQVIVIDEPELGLHPKAIQLVAEVAHSVSHQTQVLFATQSTAFLNAFQASDVVVVERKGGKTHLQRPDVERLADWLQDYSLAEVFEKGLLGGRP